MRKQLLSILALLCLTVSSAWAAPDVIGSGTTGDVTWTLTDDGVLTISGTGNMGDCTWDDCPWSAYWNDITDIVIGDGLTTINEGAFAYCYSLTTLNIPNSVTSIGESAFYGCGLTTLNIGSGVTTIGDYAFEGCGNLTYITVSGGTYFKSVNNVLFTFDGKILIQYPIGSTATSYVIPDCVETIGVSAFEYSELSDVTIPNGVTTIGDCAFFNCVDLKEVTIPNSVTTIGDDAFAACENLTTVTLNSNPYIGYNAFDIDGNGTTPAVTMNLTANAAGGAKWMTFCNTYGNFQADANTQVFQAELVGSTLTLREIDDKIVNAWEAVILKSSGNPVMTLTTEDSSDPYGYNSLAGVSDPDGRDNDGNLFVLNNGTNGVGFYKLAASKTTLEYGKACLWYDGALAPSFLGFDETTGINAVNGSESMVNGSDIYNLNGQRVAQPTKGLYIVNGKKVVINK